MGNGLPFSFEVVFLMLVLPIALVWLTSVASIATIALHKSAMKLLSRLRPRPHASPHPPQREHRQTGPLES